MTGSAELLGWGTQGNLGESGVLRDGIEALTFLHLAIDLYPLIFFVINQ